MKQLVAPVLLAHGFRPFFLAAGLYAPLSLLVWLPAWLGAWRFPSPWPLVAWHGHEMVFGFAAAVISGFLLTSVPQWTQTPARSGAPLAAAVAAWGLGRLALWCAAWWPPLLVALFDLLLFPVLLALVAPPIFAARRARNYGFPLLLLGLFAANALVHAERIGWTAGTTATGLRLGVWIVCLLIVLVAGRVVPSFTANALRRLGVAAGVRTFALVERALWPVLCISIALDLLGAPGRLAAAFFAAAAALLLLRSIGFRPTAALGDPLVWVLHAGHAWLVVGFAAAALSAWRGALPPTIALHALTTGAIGTMTLAIMSRAALGHTGRALRAPAAATLAYVCVSAGAVLRVVAPLVGTAAYTATLAAAGVFWAAGFAVFALAYWPMLTRPRVDGRPG